MPAACFSLNAANQRIPIRLTPTANRMKAMISAASHEGTKQIVTSMPTTMHSTPIRLFFPKNQDGPQQLARREHFSLRCSISSNTFHLSIVCGRYAVRSCRRARKTRRRDRFGGGAQHGTPSDASYAAYAYPCPAPPQLPVSPRTSPLDTAAHARAPAARLRQSLFRRGTCARATR